MRYGETAWEEKFRSEEDGEKKEGKQQTDQRLPTGFTGQTQEFSNRLCITNQLVDLRVAPSTDAEMKNDHHLVDSQSVDVCFLALYASCL